MDPYIPFCGTPPTPQELMSRWLFDPALLTGLALFGAVLAWRAPNRLSAVGWSLVALLFISPLCALSMSLFAARVAQHVLLTLVAAPVLALAWPLVSRRIPGQVWMAAFLFAALFWLWHSPVPYAATLQSDLIYWLMHLSLAGAAWWLASSLIAGLAAQPGQGVLALAFTAGQMTLLSAVLLFSTTAWHPWHDLTAAPYGFTALADQQLAAAMMWTGGGALILLSVAMLAYRFVVPIALREPQGRAINKMELPL
ncbi:cytochrome c oxidase assembly protein [Pseudaestuariivita sp.]|uniref:cytochrome c oxidase assembly protein n=1 Tax=Pseudaestuariivita sp. TaxID=2211669 RepID=UPI004058B346